MHWKEIWSNPDQPEEIEKKPAQPKATGEQDSFLDTDSEEDLKKEDKKMTTDCKIVMGFVPFYRGTPRNDLVPG
jgi:hypothetical protein